MATIRAGDMEVVSTLINEGVDMNAIIHEVCIANSYSCFYVSVLMHVMIVSVITQIRIKVTTEFLS